MMVFLTLTYVAILLLLIKTGKVPNSSKVWLTLIPFELLMFLGFFFPMQWGAPSGDVIAKTYSVGITPNVVGEVIEVPVKPNAPLSKGDVLFRIDPTIYQAALDGLNAQRRLAEVRLKQSQELVKQDAGSVYELQSYQAQVDSLAAQISNAEYNLKETTVRAPADGYVTNVALRPGMRAANAPSYKAMAFIDTSQTDLIAQIHQIYVRFIEPGQAAEVTFKTLPGKVFPAKVEFLIPVTAQGEGRTTGTAVQTLNTAPGPFQVRLTLDDPELMASLHPGSVGEVAIYTSHVRLAHIIRKVMIRMSSFVNYLVPA